MIPVGYHYITAHNEEIATMLTTFAADEIVDVTDTLWNAGSNDIERLEEWTKSLEIAFERNYYKFLSFVPSSL